MSDEGRGLVAAFQCSADHAARDLDWDAVRSANPENGVLWLHLDYSKAEAQHWLRAESGLPAAAVDALMAKETRPRCTIMGTGVLAVLHGVNPSPGEDPEDMVSLRLWLEPDRIISSRKRRLFLISDLRSALTSGRGPSTTGEFLIFIVDRMTQRLGSMVGEIEDTVDELEDTLMTMESADLRAQLADVRRAIIIMRRHMAPQREALARLQLQAPAWFKERERLQLREINDSLVRHIEELDAARDRAALISEELANRLAEQTNKRMYVLSILSLIFLPLTFLTGLLGINVAGIPAADQPWAFVAVIGMVLLVALIEIALFWRSRWL